MVKQGRTISLILSAGSAWSKVPNLRGKSEAEAEARLTDVHLVIGKQEQAHHDTVEFGQVIETRPHAGARLKRASKVHLLLSKGPRPGRTPEGEDWLSGQPSQDTSPRAGEIAVEVPPGPSLQQVKIIVSDNNGQRVVFEEFRSPGEVVHQQIEGEGRTTVRVYIAGTLAREEDVSSSQGAEGGSAGP